MPDYRIYRIDRENHIAGVREFPGVSDDDALAEAAEMVTTAYGIEVWDRGRLVGRLVPRARSE